MDYHHLGESASSGYATSDYGSEDELAERRVVLVNGVPQLPPPPPPPPPNTIQHAHNTPVPGNDAHPEMFIPPLEVAPRRDYYQPTTRQMLDPSESFVWGRDDARALRWPAAGTGQDDALISAKPTAGCTPLHIAFASRRWEHAASVLRDPAPIALRWLRALALQALQALDKAQAAPDRSRHELQRIAESAAEEVATAWCWARAILSLLLSLLLYVCNTHIDIFIQILHTNIPLL